MKKEFFLPFTKIRLPTPSEAFPHKHVVSIPLLSVELVNTASSRKLLVAGLVDSGADNCTFPALFGRYIGLDIEAGGKSPIAGVGQAIAYYHDIRIQFHLDSQPYLFNCFAGFTPALDQLGIGLLGREGFFDLFDEIAFNTKKQFARFTVGVG